MPSESIPRAGGPLTRGEVPAWSEDPLTARARSVWARAAAELLRVTRPGGRVAMANWTPDGFVGQMLRVHTSVVRPPSGVPSPLEWGREDLVRVRFGNRVTSLICTSRTLELRFPFPPAAVTELFATCYGPTVATLRATDPEGSSRLRDELTPLFQHH